MSKAMTLVLVLCAVVSALGMSEDEWEKFEGIVQDCAKEKLDNEEVGVQIVAYLKETLPEDEKPSKEAAEQIEKKLMEMCGSAEKYQELHLCIGRKVKA